MSRCVPFLRAPGCPLRRPCSGVCPRNRHDLRSERPCTPACPPRGTPANSGPGPALTTAPASRYLPRLCLPRPLQMPALRCEFALAIAGLVSLLMQPEGALGEELQVPQPRAASWLNLGSIKKYLGKLFNSSPKKSKNHKKTANATDTSPSKATKPPPWTTTNPQWLNTSEPRPPTSSRGPR
ncbi:uncharacterized protein LOC130540942 [Pan paniscus]|uniref:uncharacterized protein LOC130540942 n=1 Tax=Pan paniscus TaxID=9597 RepID=UPI00254647E2|nr:uncharacterized protein LOC130540942 [Pan paniscus]